VTIRPSEPLCLTSHIKRQIRKRKILYKKAKLNNSELFWNKFKQIRDHTITLICTAKQNHIHKLAHILQSNTHTKSWWSTLEHSIKPNSNTVIPPLRDVDTVLNSNDDKANLLNNLFCSHSYLDDTNVNVPDLTEFH